MRTPILAGNWKLYKTQDEAADFVRKLNPQTKDVKDREIIICPTYTSLNVLNYLLKKTNIQLGAQNLFWEDSGAYTGEISAPLLKDIGCSHVIIGHSERRQYFGETDASVNKKIKAALKAKLTPIVCVGERLEEREAGKTFQVIEKQINEGLKNLEFGNWDLVIAYEPIWAIGTGKTATPAQAQEVHAYIRKLLGELFGQEIADKTRILYGGSVKPENIKELMQQPDIDGALVGGASLKADSFAKLIKY